MQKPEKGIQPAEIIEMIKRRRWCLIVTFFLVPMIGIYLALSLPKIYQAQNIIWVQPQRVPMDYVESVVSTDSNARIRTISQQIMSRSNLERIIKDFSLYSGPEYKTMFIEDKIADLQENISVEFIMVEDQQQEGWRRGGTLSESFSISFKGKDPEKVLKITNALTSYVIDENLRERTTQAIGTSEFLDEELNIIRKELVVQEAKLKEYREMFMGGLPEQLETNLRILERFEEQLNAKQANLRDAESRLALIKLQISEEEQSLLNAGVRVTRDGQYVVDPGKPLSPDQAKALLSQLEARYTERHPDVIRLKKMISDFEKKNEKNTEGLSGEMGPLFGNSRLQFEAIKAEIQKHVTEISQLKRTIWKYQKLVEETPKREQQLLLLQRDYEEIKNTYTSLQNRKMEARMAVNLEKKQKGEQFRIISPAWLPEKPISPNMVALFIILVAAGLGIGSGLIFLLEYLDTSFRNPEEVESLLRVPVLATIPIIYKKGDIIKHKFYNSLSVFLITLSIVLFTGFAILTFNGVEQTMKLVGEFIVL
jgi:polysaccharide chain length determinant protein (PEP-CTERM system associated)